MAFFRRILFPDGEVFEPFFDCNSSCEVTPPPSVNTASIADHDHNIFNVRNITIFLVFTFRFCVSLIVYFVYRRRRQRPRLPLLPMSPRSAPLLPPPPHADAAASFPPSDHAEEIHPVRYIDIINQAADPVGAATPVVSVGGSSSLVPRTPGTYTASSPSAAACVSALAACLRSTRDPTVVVKSLIALDHLIIRGAFILHDQLTAALLHQPASGSNPLALHASAFSHAAFPLTS